MANRKKSSKRRVADARDLPPDFVGLIKDGKVLVDDTAYFRMQREVAPIVEYLRDDSRVQAQREELSAVMERVDDGLKTLLWSRMSWLEQAMISAFAKMLKEAKEGKR